MIRPFYRFLCGVMRPWYAVFLPAEVDGTENIPAEGGFILCCNHVSARDPIYLAVRCRTRMLHFMGKEELFRNPLLGWVLRKLEAFPVSRGQSDLNSVRNALGLIKDGHGLALFPQGTRSRDNSRTPMLSGTAMIALRAGCPVIPAFIGGPYRLFRKTQVSFGAPVDLSDFGRRADKLTLDAATRRIEDAVWSLKKEC